MLAAVLGLVLVGGVAATAAVPAAADAPRYKVVDLGLDGDSEATAINDSGHVVGNHSPQPFVTRPFLWSNGHVTELIPAGELGRATDINDFDVVVGARILNRGRETRAFVWRRGVLTDLRGLPGATSTWPSSINNRGDIVGYSQVGAFGVHAVRWRDGVITDLGTLPGDTHSLAQGTNIDGVAVGESGVFLSVAVRWDRNGVVEQLTDVPSTAYAVNDLGVITGRVYEGNTHGFIWKDGNFTEIPHPPGPEEFLQPFSINNQTQIVGTTLSGAFLWQNDELTILPRLGPSFASAYDINNRGEIIGSSLMDPNGTNPHAVLWSLDQPSGS